ncbi:conserved hypothetical protein [metagenome]|uniref:HTH cro/C1-type domain-containing protein n=1 Tax=metagenome TaxID=256318 RepID=A0A2P2CAV9_9ZZZZ
MSSGKVKGQELLHEQGRTDFVSGEVVLDDLLALPGMRDAVDAGPRANAEMDRVYAESLSAIRHAGQLTQQQVAERLGIGQAAVSRIESRGDLLLSTLSDYLEAAGATNSRIVVTLHGVEVELELRTLRNQASHA